MKISKNQVKKLIDTHFHAYIVDDFYLIHSINPSKLLTYNRFDISGAGPTAVARWKKQYLAELGGQTPTSGKAMTPEQQEIQSLKKRLWRAKRDNEILKKATALFAMDSQ